MIRHDGIREAVQVKDIVKKQPCNFLRVDVSDAGNIMGHLG